MANPQLESEPVDGEQLAQVRDLLNQPSDERMTSLRETVEPLIDNTSHQLAEFLSLSFWEVLQSYGPRAAAGWLLEIVAHRILNPQLKRKTKEVYSHTLEELKTSFFEQIADDLRHTIMSAVESKASFEEWIAILNAEFLGGSFLDRRDEVLQQFYNHQPLAIRHSQFLAASEKHFRWLVQDYWRELPFETQTLLESISALEPAVYEYLWDNVYCQLLRQFAIQEGVEIDKVAGDYLET